MPPFEALSWRSKKGLDIVGWSVVDRGDPIKAKINIMPGPFLIVLYGKIFYIILIPLPHPFTWLNQIKIDNF